MKNIEQKLEKIGLNSNSLEIYKYLLSRNMGTVQDVSKGLKLPRTTVHQNIEKLVKLGMIAQVKKNNVRFLYPESPEVINKIIDKFLVQKTIKENLLDNANKPLVGLIGNIISIPEGNLNTEVDIKYLEEKSLISDLYNDILQAEEVKSYVNTSEVLNHFPENEEKFYLAAKNGIKVWDLQIKSERASQFRKLCEGIDNYYVKFFPDGVKFHAMDYLIYSDSIAIVQGTQMPTAVVIKSKNLADNARSLYDLLWGFLP